ncbi:glycine zipper 2TM domain-containing protein [Marinagarivorans cellulosilyticus]|uniref:Glycine zipper 2TM domain-containing protein n=1 Tax=Marinagarivorans cellulosilyticus TaxID=2721545 RepID=A0AAN1WG16_9GAMM|nr:glycine zipper 2TM domain-containing protein [Marinagarivorans cellulosilyticus]BCD96937.1 hypothetical protein MARGE09_P1137 [Marinagarivorans cellulosilyticus]
MLNRVINAATHRPYRALRSVTLALGAIGISTMPLAGLAEHAPAEGASIIDTARVFSSVPVYTTIKEVEPRQECWVETIAQEHYIPPEPARYNNAPVIVGGVIGGALGHAVGHGRSNKKLGAVVGSVLGAAVGHSVGNKPYQSRREGYTEVSYRDVERCKTVEQTSTRRVFEGYDVTYEYRGNVYTTRMASSPGKELQLAVQFTPIES